MLDLMHFTQNMGRGKRNSIFIDRGSKKEKHRMPTGNPMWPGLRIWKLNDKENYENIPADMPAISKTILQYIQG